MSNIRDDESLERQVERVTNEDRVESLHTSIERAARENPEQDKKEPPQQDKKEPEDQGFQGPVNADALEEERDRIFVGDESLTADPVGRTEEILGATEESNDMADFLFNVVPNQFAPSDYQGTAMEFEGRAGYLKVADHGDKVSVGYEVDDTIRRPETDPNITISGMKIGLDELPQYQDGEVFLLGEVDGKRTWEEVYQGEDMLEVLERAADLDDEIYEVAGELSSEELI